MNEQRKQDADYPNYFDEMIQLGSEVQLGQIAKVAIYHDDWCAFFGGGVCNCEPEVKQEWVKSADEVLDELGES